MRILRYLLAGLLGVCLAGGGYLWLTLLSPYTYQRPTDLPPVAAGEHRVFVYGTLRYSPVRWLVYGRSGDPEPVILDGYRRDGLDLVADRRAHVSGLLLRVSGEELRRLDRYERLGVRYERVRLPLPDDRTAWVYRRR